MRLTVLDGVRALILLRVVEEFPSTITGKKKTYLDQLVDENSSRVQSESQRDSSHVSR